MVNRTKLHRFVDKTRVREALDAAEALTAAPIHVSIAPAFWGDVRRTAERAFRKHAHGVLLFVVPSRRKFAIIGDLKAHEALGQHAWDAIAAEMTKHFAAGDATTGIVTAIEELSRALADW